MKLVLSKKAQEARREYHRKWQREHPDNVREAKRRYWEKKAQEGSASNAKENIE